MNHDNFSNYELIEDKINEYLEPQNIKCKINISEDGRNIIFYNKFNPSNRCYRNFEFDNYKANEENQILSELIKKPQYIDSVIKELNSAQ